MAQAIEMFQETFGQAGTDCATSRRFRGAERGTLYLLWRPMSTDFKEIGYTFYVGNCQWISGANAHPLSSSADVPVRTACKARLVRFQKEREFALRAQADGTSALPALSRLRRLQRHYQSAHAAACRCSQHRPTSTLRKCRGPACPLRDDRCRCPWCRQTAGAPQRRWSKS